MTTLQKPARTPRLVPDEDGVEVLHRGIWTPIALGLIATAAVAVLAIVAWYAVPETIRVVVFDQGGGSRFGEVPAFPVAIVNTVQAVVGAGWLIFVAIVWPRYQFTRILIPGLTYGLGGFVMVFLVIWEDPYDYLRIAVVFLAFISGLFLVIMLAIVASKTPAPYRPPVTITVRPDDERERKRTFDLKSGRTGR